MSPSPPGVSSSRIAVSAFYATVALALSIALNATCHFVQRTLVDTTIQEEHSHSVGLWRWEIDETCYPYTLCKFGSICLQPNFDSAFGSAKAFAVLTPVIGAVGVIVLFVAVFRPFKISWLCIPFLVLCLFQGLTLMVFRSDLCVYAGDTTFWGNLTVRVTTDANETDVDIQIIPEDAEVRCGHDAGSKMAIAATVMWLITSLTCFRNVKKRQ